MDIANSPEVAGQSKSAFWEFCGGLLFECLGECEFFWLAAVIVAVAVVLYGFLYLLWNACQQNFAG